MSSRVSAHTVERAIVLVDVAQGLLIRSWAVKSAILSAGADRHDKPGGGGGNTSQEHPSPTQLTVELSPGHQHLHQHQHQDGQSGSSPTSSSNRYPSLLREEWSKIRRKLESSFPELPDLAKIPGYDSLKIAADEVIKENVDLFGLLIDLLEFKTSALEVLYSLLGTRGQFKAPQILQVALDLVVSFSQLHIFWSLMEDRKYMVALFMSAHHIKSDHRNDPYYSRIAAYLEESSSGLKWLVQQFTPISSSVGDILMEFSDILPIALNVTLLRQMNAFNILEEGASMALPVKKRLSARAPHLFLHAELAASDRYAQYVVWGGLVCPAELYRDSVLGLFKSIVVEHAVVPIYREQVLEVQPAVEEVFTWFPPKGFTLPADGVKDLKPKRFFKDLFKDFFSATLLRHRERASYLNGELANVCNIFRNIPGLLAPKAPLVLALASLVKAEILWIMMHNAEERKKGKKNANGHDKEASSRTPASRVAELIGLLGSLEALVSEHAAYIKEYYHDYLKGAQKASLALLIPEAITSIKAEGEMKAILEGLVKHLEAFSIPASSDESPHLKAIRIGWIRVLGHLAANPGSNGSEATRELMERMNAVVLMSQYVDDLDGLCRRAFMLHPLWFYRNQLHTLFNQVLAANDGDGIEHSLALVRVLAVADKNVSPAYAEEERAIHAASAILATELVEEFMSKMIKVIQEMSENVNLLVLQVSPVEALHRLERSQAIKAHEPLPGSESTANGFEGSAIVRHLMRLQHLAAVAAQSISQSPEIKVAYRTFHLKRHLIKRIEGSLALHVHSCFEQANPRPSVALASIVSYTRTLQRVTQYIKMDILASIRKIFLDTGWLSTTVQGLGGESSGAHRNSMAGGGDHFQANQHLQDQTRPIGRIAACFISFIDSISSSSSSASALSTQPRVIYVESRRTYLKYPTIAGKAGSNTVSSLGGSILEADLLTDVKELRALVELVGPVGIEIIDAEILSYTRDQFRDIKSFLDINASVLSDFMKTYTCISPARNVNLTNLTGLDRLVEAMRKAGHGLALRRLLYDALAEQQNNAMPSLTSLLTNACSSVDIDPLLLDNRSLKGFDRLTRFTGSSSLASHDTKLAQCLDQVTNDWHSWGALIYAVAIGFIAEWWKGASYIIEHDAFSGNEHLVIKVLGEVLHVMKGKSSAAPDRDKVDIKSLGREFIKASSFVLLKIKQNQQHDRNVNVLFTALEKVVDWVPEVDRGLLESIVPYPLFHQAMMELSLSNQSSSASSSKVLIPLTGGFNPSFDNTQQQSTIST